MDEQTSDTPELSVEQLLAEEEPLTPETQTPVSLEDAAFWAELEAEEEARSVASTSTVAVDVANDEAGDDELWEEDEDDGYGEELDYSLSWADEDDTDHEDSVADVSEPVDSLAPLTENPKPRGAVGGLLAAIWTRSPEGTALVVVAALALALWAIGGMWEHVSAIGGLIVALLSAYGHRKARIERELRFGPRAEKQWVSISMPASATDAQAGMAKVLTVVAAHTASAVERKARARGVKQADIFYWLRYRDGEIKPTATYYIEADPDLIGVLRQTLKNVYERVDVRRVDANPLAHIEQALFAEDDAAEQLEVVSFRARQLHHSARSILESPMLRDDFDEVSGPLSAFAQLQPGEEGLIRLSLRDRPEFGDEAQDYIDNLENPVIEPSKAAHVAYWFSYLWWFAMRNNKTFGGSTPPASPSTIVEKRSKLDVKDKKAKASAEKKAGELVHFEVDLRVAAIGPHGDQEHLTKVAEGVTRQFDVFNTITQRLIFERESMGIDAIRGYMGQRPAPEAQLVGFSLPEVVVLGSPPDKWTDPDGIEIERQSFVPRIPPKPVLVGAQHRAIDDLDERLRKQLYEGEPGLTPLSVINVGSHDQQVIGERVSAFDTHAAQFGRTGSGKTEELKWGIYGAAKADYPIAFIDPHGVASSQLARLLGVLLPERLNDIVLCDLSDPDFPVALNPLDISSPPQVDDAVSAVRELLARQLSLGKNNAPRAVVVGEAALTAMAEVNLEIKKSNPQLQLALTDVVPFLTDPELRQLIVSFSNMPFVREWFKPETGLYEKNANAQQDLGMAIIRAFQELGRSRAFSGVFSSPENKLDFGRLVADNKIVLVKLDRVGGQQQIGEFIAAMILPLLMASMGQWGRTYDEETDTLSGRGCRVFVDEAHRVLGPESPIESILAECRKWDMGMWLTSQYPAQFDKDVLASMLANTEVKLTGRLDPDNARALANNIRVPADEIVDLPKYHLVGNVNGQTFSGANPPPLSADRGDPSKTAQAKEDAAKAIDVITRNSRLLLTNPAPGDDIYARQEKKLKDVKALLREKLKDRQMADPSTSGSQYGDPFNDPLGS